METRAIWKQNGRIPFGDLKRSGICALVLKWKSVEESGFVFRSPVGHVQTVYEVAIAIGNEEICGGGQVTVPECGEYPILQEASFDYLGMNIVSHQRFYFPRTIASTDVCAYDFQRVGTMAR